MVVFVGNGFIRSAASDIHHGLLDGISYAFWGRFPIQPANLKQEGCGMHKCIPYESVDVFMMI